MSINNTKYGVDSLKSNSGSDNTGVGAYAGYSNLNGEKNTAIGSNSSFYNTSGSNNTALGAGSLCNNTTGSLNTAIGSNALEGVGQQSVGNENVAIGAQALYLNKGDLNTAIGAYSAVDITDGSYNTFLGAYTTFDDLSANYQYSTSIGYNAKISGSNQIMMGGTGPQGYPNVYIPGNGFLPNFSISTVEDDQIITKKYVDSIAQGLNQKSPCSCIANSDVIISPSPIDVSSNNYTILYTIDGYTTKVNDRVLINNQGGNSGVGPSIQNGIYSITTDPSNGGYIWVRSSDMPDGSNADGAACFIDHGDKYQATNWTQPSTTPAANVGNTPLLFIRYSSFSYRLGRGLDKQTFDI